MNFERYPIIRTVPTETLKAIDEEARKDHNIEAQTLVSSELARRAMAAEVAYDANDGTLGGIDHNDESWIVRGEN